MHRILHTLFLILILGLIWESTILVFDLPPYIFPSPKQVINALIQYHSVLCEHGTQTLLEILAGLFVGTILGIVTAIFLFYNKVLSRLLLLILLISQAIPIFAIAPILVLWFGFGFFSKLVMTTIIIFFPITSNVFDALKNTPQEMIFIAKSCGATPLQILTRVRLPAALPSVGSGIRIAATIAPIGAVVGEWVGASHGLGYLMLISNARMQSDMLFAALSVLIFMTLTLYFIIDKSLKKFIFWNGN